MKPFSISEIYVNKDNLKSIDINPLPQKYCSFDCVFCELGRTDVITEDIFSFKENIEFINRLNKFVIDNNIEYVFINPNGEALANKELLNIIKLLKEKNIKIKLLGNGYIFSNLKYREILDNCDEVIGELCVTENEDFKIFLRPIKGYTIEEYIKNLKEFRDFYKGKFILDITLVNKCCKREDFFEKMDSFIKELNPDEVFFETTRGKYSILAVDSKLVKQLNKQYKK